MSNSNTGEGNSGDWNSGDSNSGSGNSGSGNSGSGNSGYRNSGNRNSGDWNSGNRNSGDWNSGDSNSGSGNSGSGNSGDWNSGGWNSGNGNSGYLNTDEPKMRIFNKETDLSRNEVDKLIPDFFYFNSNEWIYESDMTKEEKESNPSYKTTGGFLRVKGYKKAWRDAWDQATDKDRRKCLDLPNWDNKLFLEISGINVEKELNQRDTVEIGGQKYLRSEVESKLKNLKPVE